MGSLLILAALATLPRAPVASDRVDLIEVNHFYGDEGQHIFDQLIFWDWSDCDCRFHVRAWRLLRHHSQWPQLDRQRGMYVCVWLDGDTLRRVRAVAYRETWTQFDPELLEREIIPQAQRAGLSKE